MYLKLFSRLLKIPLHLTLTIINTYGIANTNWCAVFVWRCEVLAYLSYCSLLARIEAMFVRVCMGARERVRLIGNRLTAPRCILYVTNEWRRKIFVYRVCVFSSSFHCIAIFDIISVCQLLQQNERKNERICKLSLCLKWLRKHCKARKSNKKKTKKIART